METPRVTRDDVLRVVRREFSRDHETALKILDGFCLDPETGKPNTDPFRARVQLAALKMSRGDINELRVAIDGAKEDYRDMLGLAEWTQFNAIGFNTLGNWTPAEVEQMHKDDFAAHQEWLQRP